MADPTDNSPDTPRVIGPWRKSTYTNEYCVEIARATDDHIALRNSNDLSQGEMYLTEAQVASLIHAIKAGLLDDL